MPPSQSLIAPAALLASALLAACYEPEAAYGLPCTDDLRCPKGQRCFPTAADGLRCMTGPVIDELPAPTSPPNDLPANAIDVSRGGRFDVAFGDSHDDLATSCAAGRPEVFYQLKLAAPEVIYLDTFDLGVDTALSIRPGSCAAAGEETACIDNSCGGMQSQGAWKLPAGDHCIVVEGPAGTSSPDDMRATGKLEVVRGEQNGDPLPDATGTLTGDSCRDDDSNQANCDCGAAEDHHYFFTVCPATTVMARFETCGSTFDTVLQIRRGNGNSLGCNDEDTCDAVNEVLARTISTAGLYFAIVEGCNDCGNYMLKYSVTAAPQ